jgi:hypothetical protein
MNKAILFVIALLAISSATVCMASDESDASEYIVENARIPDIYAVETDQVHQVIYSYGSGGGWARHFVFISGSPNDIAFKNAIENKGNFLSIQQDGNNQQQGKRTIYVASTAPENYIGFGSGDLLLDNSQIIYKSETRYNIMSGVDVKIKVPGGSDDLYFGEGYSPKKLEPGQNNITITSKRDYMILGNSSNMYASYTIDYDDSTSEHNVAGLICTGLGVLGIISLILLGRKQKIQ